MLVVRLPSGSARNVAEAVHEYLASIEEEIVGSVRDKMRRGVDDPEFSEQGSLRSTVTGPPRPSLRVYSDSVKAAVDETGRSAGGFPPFGVRSALLEWARFWFPENPRHAAFNIARAINERGLPRPGDPLRRPFRTTQQEMGPEIRRGLRLARAEAVRRTNATA